MTDTGTKPDPVQDALTDLVSAGETVRRLTAEHQTYAYVAALQGGQVPRIITEQTIDALKQYSTALLELETATCATAPDAVLRAACKLVPGDRIRRPGTDGPFDTVATTVRWPGHEILVKFWDRPDITVNRLTRFEVHPVGSWEARTADTEAKADDAFGDGAA